MKTNSICSQLEMKCALEVFGAVCVAVSVWFCEFVCLATWEFVTMHVWCMGVTE